MHRAYTVMIFISKAQTFQSILEVKFPAAGHLYVHASLLSSFTH